MTNDRPGITNADDCKLVRLIEKAERRVLLLSPGASENVARALATAWKRLGGQAVSVILDVDPEVCRLGYGSMEALRILRDTAASLGSLVCHQPGVRIGLLIADDLTLIFCPTPLLIEAGAFQPDRPNAIQLPAPPGDVVNDLGLGDRPNLERKVGLDPVQPHQIESVERDLAAAPPVKFDLARRVRVFTARFQFVELEMPGCFISRKKVPIPSQLVGLAKRNEIQSQFHAHFNLINREKLEVKTCQGRVITEKSLQAQRQQIVRDYLIGIKDYGSVVLRANKSNLESAVEELRAAVKEFQIGVIQNLQELMDNNAETLVDALLPAVIANPPEAYTKFFGPDISEDQLRELLAKDIKNSFGNAQGLASDMKVSLVFKDVAYESLVDTKFLKVAREAMPNLEQLHEEFDAAKAEDDDPEGM